MTASSTPAIITTQVGGAQIVTFTASATMSQTPSMGNAMQDEHYFISLFPNAPPQVESTGSVNILLLPFGTKVIFAPLRQRRPKTIYGAINPNVVGP